MVLDVLFVVDMKIMEKLVHKSLITYKEIKETTKGYHLLYGRHINKMGEEVLIYIQFNNQCHLVVNTTSHILAYKVTIPIHLVTSLATSAFRLPHPNLETHGHGHYKHVHYTL